MAPRVFFVYGVLSCVFLWFVVVWLWFCCVFYKYVSLLIICLFVRYVISFPHFLCLCIIDKKRRRRRKRAQEKKLEVETSRPAAQSPVHGIHQNMKKYHQNDVILIEFY